MTLHFQQNFVPQPTDPARCRRQCFASPQVRRREFKLTLRTRHVRATSDLVDVAPTILLGAFLTPLPPGGFDFLALRVQFPALFASLTGVADFSAQEATGLPAARAF